MCLDWWYTNKSTVHSPFKVFAFWSDINLSSIVFRWWKHFWNWFFRDRHQLSRPILWDLLTSWNLVPFKWYLTFKKRKKSQGTIWCSSPWGMWCLTKSYCARNGHRWKLFGGWDDHTIHICLTTTSIYIRSKQERYNLVCLHDRFHCQCVSNSFTLSPLPYQQWQYFWSTSYIRYFH